MVLSGWPLAVAVALLIAWLSILCFVLSKNLRQPSARRSPRELVTIAGLTCSAIAVASALAFHLSWISPSVSQWLGVRTTGILWLILFCPAILGLALALFSLGRARIISLFTSLVMAALAFTFVVGSALSMGPTSIARHPSRYLIPDGYVGWITIRHAEDAAPTTLLRGERVYEIPSSGTLATSTGIENGSARDEYFYYASDGSLRPLPESGWGGGGLIWGDGIEQSVGSNGLVPKQFSQIFFVGTEEQFKEGEGRPHEATH
jgi:hypothetical protein